MLLVHCYLGRKGVQQTGLLLKTFWIDFAPVLLVVCQTVKLQFRYFHRSGEFTFKGLVWFIQVKGNERKNLNIETDFIKLPMSMAFLPKLTSTCCNLQLLWNRPLTSLPWTLQENNMDSIKVVSQRLKGTLHGFFYSPLQPQQPRLKFVLYHPNYVYLSSVCPWQCSFLMLTQHTKLSSNLSLPCQEEMCLWLVQTEKPREHGSSHGSFHSDFLFQQVAHLTSTWCFSFSAKGLIMLLYFMRILWKGNVHF